MKAKNQDIQFQTRYDIWNTVQPIHKDDIPTVLKFLENQLNIPLIDNTIGSAGKKEYSGDIDVVVDESTFTIEELRSLISRLKNCKAIMTSHLLMSIIDARKLLNMDNYPNGHSGFIQVDFMIGNISWLKTFYHAPDSKDSMYPGSYRNILLSCIASHFKRSESIEQTPDGRPLSIYRFLFSYQSGLSWIKRTPKYRQDKNGFTKSNLNFIVVPGVFNEKDIAAKLELGDKDCLYSFETLWKRINTVYDESLVRAIATEFNSISVIVDKGIPKEITEFLLNEIESSH